MRVSVAEQRANALMTPVFSAEVERDAIDAIAAGLKATKRVRVRKDGHIHYEDIPDTQFRALLGLKVIEHQVGKPIARTITADVTPGRGHGGADSFFAQLASDPSTVRSMQETLTKMADAAEKAKPIEITSSPALPKATEAGS